MSLLEQKEEVQRLSGYHLIARLRELASQAASGDGKAMQLLSAMLEDCKDLAIWRQNSRYASAVLHAVGQVRNLKAMQLLIGLARALPEGTPAGAIELIASILPEFRRFVMGAIRQLVEKRDGSPAFLVGVQTLCNLYIEGYLEGSDIEYLGELIDGLKTDDYITQHIIDLVAAEIGQHKSEQEKDLDAFLVELVS